MMKALLSEKTRLTERLKRINSELSKLPAGSLRVTPNHNTYQYYIDGIYVKKSERKSAEQVALREYYEDIQHSMSVALERIESLIKSYQNNAPDDKFSNLCRGRKALLTNSIFQSTEQKIAAFESLANPGHTAYPVESDIYTNKDENVRSKTEKIIADELFRSGIPYKYELPLTLFKNGREIVFHPDFTVMNIRTGKIMYIEHLGLMDDSIYSNRAIEKIGLMEQNNIILGRDLLIFHESRGGDFDARIMKKYIEEYLL